jgi:hypothetical protein
MEIHMKQRLCGLILVAISIVNVFITKDITAVLIFLPMGIYFLFTKKQIMMFFDLKQLILEIWETAKEI